VRLKREARVSCVNEPQRKSIIAEVVHKKLVNLVPKELAELFTFIETEFDPLNLAKRVKPLFGS